MRSQHGKLYILKSFSLSIFHWIDYFSRDRLWVRREAKNKICLHFGKHDTDGINKRKIFKLIFENKNRARGRARTQLKTTANYCVNLLIISPNAMTSKGRLNLSWIIFFNVVYDHVENLIACLPAAAASSSVVIAPMPPPPPTITIHAEAYILFNSNARLCGHKSRRAHSRHNDSASLYIHESANTKERKKRQMFGGLAFALASTTLRTCTHNQRNHNTQHNRLVGSSTKAESLRRIKSYIHKYPFRVYFHIAFERASKQSELAVCREEKNSNISAEAIPHCRIFNATKYRIFHPTALNFMRRKYSSFSHPATIEQ